MGRKDSEDECCHEPGSARLVPALKPSRRAHLRHDARHGGAVDVFDGMRHGAVLCKRTEVMIAKHSS